MNKQTVNINFSQGVDTKTDPWQLQPGQLLGLQNSVFSKGGMMQKRNGYSPLTAAPSVASYLTTLNDSLTSVSSTINAYTASTEKWVEKGTFCPVGLSTLPLIRNNANQVQCDAALSDNGLLCVAYTETANGTTTYKYVVVNADTGQNLIAPTLLPVTSGSVAGSPRVFFLDGYFVVIYNNLITATNFLQYMSISSVNLSTVTTAQVTSTPYTSATTVAWDGIVYDGRLYVAFNSTSGGQSIKLTYLTRQAVSAGSAGVTAVSFTGATNKATMFTMAVDSTTPTNPMIYVSFFDALVEQAVRTLVVDRSLTTVLAPTLVRTVSAALANLASTAQSGSCIIFQELVSAYSYDSAVATNQLQSNTVTVAGVVGSLKSRVRGVGIASKAVLVDGKSYILVAYQSPFQPTYFLMDVSSTVDTSPQVLAKLAYSNGGGYLPKGLPTLILAGDLLQCPYLFKDFIASLTVQDNTQQTTTGGIYSQTGINFATFDLSVPTVSAEVASNLHLGGGFLWNYDGYLPTEHNFFLWPDSVEATWSATGGSIVAKPDGATNTNAYYYQAVYEFTDNQGNVYRSAPSIPVAVTTTGTGTAGSIVIAGPMLRLTYKTANPVKIVLYRWSVANQVYHQVTSIANPLLNTTSANDRWTFTDTLADASILGNSIIYTTGGVVENVNAPASSIITLFDTRLWLVDAEDPNLLWFSKQVIEATPVEMSDLFTFYVAPTTASQGSTGPITALAPMDDKLIIFKQNAIYYINGTGPDNTGSSNNYTQPVFITSTVGCTNPQSIVFMPNGLMFQSDKGIWLLDRSLNTTYIGAAVEAFTQPTDGTTPIVQSALNIPTTNQVRFTLNTGITLMYDYFFQQWGTFVNVPAISSCIYQGLHTYLNAAGDVFQETPGVYVDNGNPVLMSFTTGWLNIASLQGFQRAYFFYLLGRYLSPHLLNIQIAYNYNSSIAHSMLIRPNNFSSAVASPYGDQSAPFGSPLDTEQWRIFFRQQKCQSFQITLQEIYDPTLGVPAGAGFTLSGINCVVATKRGVRPIRAAQSVG